MKRYARKLILTVMFVAGLQNYSICFAAALEVKQMQVNGVNLSYIEQGKGAPVCT